MPTALNPTHTAAATVRRPPGPAARRAAPLITALFTRPTVRSPGVSGHCRKSPLQNHFRVTSVRPRHAPHRLLTEGAHRR